MRRGRPGFRLVDLLAVLFLVAVLVGLLLPTAQRVRVYGVNHQCINNLMQVGLGVHNYAATFNSALPALTSDRAKPKYGAYNGGIFVSLLPFIEQAVLYQNAVKLTPQATWSAPIPPNSSTALGTNNQPLQTTRIKVYVCPADATVVKDLSANLTTLNAAAGVYPWAASSYAANYQLFGTVNDLPTDGATVTEEQNNACVPKYDIGKIPDGSSNTVMFGEQLAACGTAAGNLWAYPAIGNYAATNYAPQPTGPGIVNAAGSPGTTTSRFWAPVFANSHPHFGFASGGRAGSIYLHNTNAPDAHPAPAQIVEPYAAGLYWDATPQAGASQWTCDKSRLQSFHAREVVVVMGDGSWRTVTTEVSQPTWYAVLRPDDGILPGDDW
jgi:hypothetical protein